MPLTWAGAVCRDIKNDAVQRWDTDKKKEGKVDDDFEKSKVNKNDICTCKKASIQKHLCIFK